VASHSNEIDGEVDGEVDRTIHGPIGGALVGASSLTSAAAQPAGPVTGGELAGNVSDLVEAAARRGPDHPALVEPGGGPTLTWGRLRAAMSAEAARLVGEGVASGDRVLVRLGQGIPFCVTLLGALRAGAIAVPVGPHLTAHELALITADCRPALLVADPGDRAVAALDPAPRVLPPPHPRPGPAPAGSAAGASVGGGEDIAVLGYTSGTTGVPRGVRLSHRALLANRAQTALLRPVPVSPADRVLLHLPLFHIYGLGAGLLQVCWAGATGVLVDRVEPADVVETIRAERITVVAGVPSMYRSILELAGRDAADGGRGLREALVTVRLCTTGGAPMAGDLLREFQAASGLDVFEGYGLTEAGPVLTSALVGGRAKAGSVGRPLPGGPGVPGVQLRLVDARADPTAPARSGAPAGSASEPQDLWDDHEDDGPDTGLVAVRGPNLFSGYWPDGEGGPDADGWFRTCDVGFVDADGDLYLVDRAGDLVIVNGFNVYPHEVERVLGELPEVAEAAVVGVPDPRTGETVKAVLVLRPGAALTAERVREHCVTRLARFKIPTVVEFAERLPRSATGKITRLALREERP
jgi:long-chain acyl-CoA synthetase